MSSDVVSRLLEAIDKVELTAQDAIDWARGGDWSEAEHRKVGWGESQDDLDVLSGGKPIATFHAEYGGAMAALHAIANDPNSVLRLCQAHRDIIEMYREAKARPVVREGREAKLRGLDHASAMGRLTTLGLVVQALARGYGVED